MFANSVKLVLAAAGEDVSGNSNPADVLAQPDTRENVKKYLQNDGETLDVFDHIMSDYKTSLAAIIGKLENIVSISLTTTDIGAAIAANQVKDGGFAFDKRLKFVMKPKEMQTAIEALDRCNDRFKGLTDRIHALNGTQVRDLSKEETSKKLAKEMQKIRHFAINLHTAMESSWQHGCQPVHTTMLILDCRTSSARQPAKMIEPQFHCLLACGDCANMMQSQLREVIISMNLKLIVKGQTALADLCSHLIKPNSTGDAIALSVDQKHKLFCDLIQHKSHFDLSTPESVSLEEALKSQLWLTPQYRTQLGMDIAASLLQLQTTHWLQESWTDRAIRFVRHRLGGQTLVDCSKPFIARTFPNIGPLHTDDHVKSDLLELGILLLEIWNLQTFDSWALSSGTELKPGYYARMTPAIQWLAESEKGRSCMAPCYVDAVDVCVKFSVQGVHPRWEHPEFRRMYCEKVLGPLQENGKMWLRS